ncbi:MAG: DUF805 domain-containing protein [Alloprevotella sp.]|nr:DUF805 domain-containing protein [Alloprevotella sp.]
MPTKTMSFVEAIKACFAKFATFKGRARRSEFWWFYLLNAIPGLAMSYLTNWKLGKVNEIQSKAMEVLFDEEKYDAIMAQAASVDSTFYTWAAVLGVIMLVLLIPGLAVWVRRLHDVGKSGHMLWLILVCGVGGLIPLVMCISDGKPEPNQYGPSPKFAPQAVPPTPEV